jgi:hypothetical protein
MERAIPDNFGAPGFGANRGSGHRGSFGLTAARKQGGMTTIGLIILVAFIGLFVFAFMRLSPIYLNYMKVVGVVDGVHEEFDGQNASRNAIRTSISRRFGVESVSVIDQREVQIKPIDGGFEIIAQYDHEAPFIANVYFLVKFDKRATVRR